MKTKDLQYAIIIPTYNRHNALAICLYSLARVVGNFQQLEVIVVDDGSDSPPYEIINWSKKYLDIRLICQPNGGPASARNSGALAAKAKNLVFIDDDCTPHIAWFKEFVTVMEQNPDAMLGGRVVNGLPGNLFSETTQLIITYLSETSRVATEKPTFFPTNNLVVPRQTFLDLGGFNAALRFGEDREFCHRWWAANRMSIAVPNAAVTHWKSLDIRRFWQLHVRYGAGSALYRQMITPKAQKGIRIEGSSYYWQLLTYPFKLYPSQRAMHISGLLLLSQLATAVGFIQAAR